MGARAREQLHRTLKEYTARAMETLAATCSEAPPEMVFRGFAREWAQIAPGVYALRERAVAWWELCILEHAEDRRALPEYEAVVTAIRADELASPQVDTLVGTALSAHRQEVDQLVDRILWDLARHAETLMFDSNAFDESFERLIADLERTECDLPIFIPLPGVKCAEVPIEVEPGLEIALLSDTEVAWCLRSGLIQTIGPVDHAMVGEVVAIRMRFSLPKIVGDERPGADSAYQLERQRLDRALAVIHALRAFKGGRFSTPGYVRLTDEVGSGAQFGPLEGTGALRRLGGNYELTSEDVAAFRSFWPQFAEAVKRTLIARAMRRFSYAADRDRADDRLTDLVIAGETLFLGDTGEAQYRGELRYRYALRAAFFVADDQSRRDVFKFMRNGYDARSAFVHGGEPKEKILQAIDGSQLSLSDFVDATEEVLRIALRKAITESKSTDGPLVDWDELIMGDPAP